MNNARVRCDGDKGIALVCGTVRTAEDGEADMGICNVLLHLSYGFFLGPAISAVRFKVDRCFLITSAVIRFHDLAKDICEESFDVPRSAFVNIWGSRSEVCVYYVRIGTCFYETKRDI